MASKRRSLVSRSRSTQPADRKQKTFNRLLSTIDRLRTRIEADTRQLEDALAFHTAHIQPRIEHVARLRADVARALSPFLDDGRLGRSAREDLRDTVAEQLDDVLACLGDLDDDLLALFERLHGASLDELERQDMDEARSQMESMFAGMGIDIDLSGFHARMNDEELAVKMAETIESMREQAGAARERQQRVQPKRRRTAHETARPAEDLRKASLGAIYRQLAKVLHPDLEPAPELRQRKSAVMQELTAAHAAGDLHTLLRLELEWIHREEADGTRLTDEKLDDYTALLREQVAGLEATLAMLPLNPRYSALVDEMGMHGFTVRLDGAAEVTRLDQLAEGLAESLNRLGTKHALLEVRDVLRTRRQMRGSW